MAGVQSLRRPLQNTFRRITRTHIPRVGHPRGLAAAQRPRIPCEADHGIHPVANTIIASPRTARRRKNYRTNQNGTTKTKQSRRAFGPTRVGS